MYHFTTIRRIASNPAQSVQIPVKNEEEYIEGIIRLAEDHDEHLGFFTASHKDEKTMMHLLEQMAV